MEIDFIADLHGFYPELEGGDLLIVAGDLTSHDTMEQNIIFCDWLLKQKYKKIVWIAGNHDNRYQFYGMKGFFLSCDQRDKSHISYLCDSGTEFEGLKIWGSPWSLSFPDINPHCAAYTGDEELLKTKYDLIPNDIDILISHSPFYGMLDQNHYGYHCGSKSLRDAVDRIRPRFFVCGHIHEQGGNCLMYKHQGPNTWCMNASYVNVNYQPTNEPIGIEI